MIDIKEPYRGYIRDRLLNAIRDRVRRTTTTPENIELRNEIGKGIGNITHRLLRIGLHLGLHRALHDDIWADWRENHDGE